MNKCGKGDIEYGSNFVERIIWEENDRYYTKINKIWYEVKKFYETEYTYFWIIVCKANIK